jgi:serine/threonine-protein kinase
LADNELTKSEWVRVKEIFINLISLDLTHATEQLQRFSDNQQIIDAVKNMLEVNSSQQDQTITPKQSAVSTMLSLGKLEAGNTFGKYTIIKSIASGGMGEVYLAERNDEVLQKVAIKVLPHNELSEQAIARFDTERRILASLEHPNIARLIDAGKEEKQAYFVMEYIDGIAIDNFCQKNKLDLKARLHLFLQVCNAVSYAHNHLIVHRDLKPSNILVTASGEVKLLDFGIAKPLKILPGTDKIHETLIGKNTLTPQYSAPEQIQGQSITVACDIYVLGLLLYRLLTDRHAFDLRDKTWGEIEQTLQQKIPNLPSESVKRAEGILSFENLSWAKKLSGDLDAIVNHALKKEINQRYTNVKSLANDLQRYLNQEPIVIKRDHRVYKLKKQLRKNWLPISALSLIFMILVISSLFIWRQSQTIKTERDKAILEKQTADQATDFIINTFKSADPTKVLGDKLSAADILKQGSIELKTKSISPAVKNKLLTVLAEVNLNLSNYDEASKLANQLMEDDYLNNVEDHIKSNWIVASIKSNTDEKVKALEILDGIDKTQLKTDEYYFQVMNLKAQILKSLNEYDKANNLATNLLTEVSIAFGYESIEYAMQLKEYGTIIRSAENRKQIHDIMEKSLAIFHKIESSDHLIEQFRTTESLIREKINLKKYNEAVDLLSELKLKYEAIYDPEHIVFAKIFSSLGNIHLNQKNIDDSLNYYRQSLSVYNKNLGSESIRSALIELNIGVVYLYETNDLQLAEQHLIQGLTKIENISGKNNNYYYMSLVYATCLVKLNQYNIAEKIIDETISYYTSRNKLKGRAMALAKSLKGHILVFKKQYVEAEKLLLSSKEKVLESYGNTFHREMIESDLLLIQEIIKD